MIVKCEGCGEDVDTLDGTEWCAQTGTCWDCFDKGPALAKNECDNCKKPAAISDGHGGVYCSRECRSAIAEWKRDLYR